MSISTEDIRYSRSLFGENIFRGKFTKILTDYCIPFEILEINNINESAGVKAISSLKQKYISVSTHDILKKPYFEMDKYFINCHKGFLPDFRGVSSSHWAVLNKGRYGATVYFMDEGIDTGKIIERREYDLPCLDSHSQLVIYGTHMVSDLLSDVVAELANGGELKGLPQEEGQYYFQIHPVLGEISKSKQLQTKLENPGQCRAKLLEEIKGKLEMQNHMLGDNAFKTSEFEYFFRRFQMTHSNDYSETLRYALGWIFDSRKCVPASYLTSALEILVKIRDKGSESFKREELNRILLPLILPEKDFSRSKNWNLSSEFTQEFRELLKSTTGKIEKPERLILALFCVFACGIVESEQLTSWKEPAKALQRQISLQWDKRHKTSGLNLSPLLIGVVSMCFQFCYDQSSDVSWVDAAMKANDIALKRMIGDRSETLDLIILSIALQKEVEIIQILHARP